MNTWREHSLLLLLLSFLMVAGCASKKKGNKSGGEPETKTEEQTEQPEERQNEQENQPDQSDPSTTRSRFPAAVLNYFDNAESEPASDWHNVFSGRTWRTAGGYLEVQSSELMISSVTVVESCMRSYGELFIKWAEVTNIKVAHLVATAITESVCTNTKKGSDGASTGLMQIIGETCQETLKDIGRAYGSDAECAAAIETNVDLNIEVAARYIAKQSRYSKLSYSDVSYSSETLALDPPKVAASYNSGGIYVSYKNAWKMRSTGDHIDRYVRAYNAYIKWIETAEIELLTLTREDSLVLTYNENLPLSVKSVADLETLKEAKIGNAIFVGDREADQGEFYILTADGWKSNASSW